jgi:hypothetical protein
MQELDCLPGVTAAVFLVDPPNVALVLIQSPHQTIYQVWHCTLFNGMPLCYLTALLTISPSGSSRTVT